MASVRMLTRVRALETQKMDSTWVVFETEEVPTDSQVTKMEQARAQGRMAILFLERYGTIWLPGFERPWLIDL